ncbi:hypothetical protein K2Z83_15790 [Oscillochloris sp. ZM17-4]|uniref:alpha/beta fold hydrolase n=1 Tax=Oscillochloris sp. ZM17-4 TaxID=2866714 RepID=UPI001C72FD66|nr:hypothetical protein [Oscillochloris sp. ZM17-4]MBX0329136.1 hypothetical protein [Oscillochloris sp. ZM17-4]
MLVPTKLRIPRPDARQVPRPRLTAALDAALDTTLTLVSAPPGYGKTSLVAGWLASRMQQVGGGMPGDSASTAGPASCAWVSLDEEDSDPQLFFGYLAAALPPVTGRRAHLAELLRSPRAHPARTLMKAFIVDASAVAGRLILSLDDFHTIDSTEIMAAMGLLLDHPSGGWARPLTRRIVGLSMLNAAGVRGLNGLTAIQFAMLRAVLDGPLGASATTAYSYRLNTAYAPRADYGRDLAAIARPLLVIAGDADEAFVAARYEPTIAAHTSGGAYVVLAGVSHIGLLTDPGAREALCEWLGGW